MAEERNPYEAKITQALRDLASLNSSKRRDAAFFMGEVAYDEAIPTLVNLYKTDKNASVRKAAAYALGQFRAVEIGMSSGQEKTITALLTQIQEGELGRRAPVEPVVRLALALVLSLIVIGVLFLFQNQIAGRFLGGKTDRTALLATVRGQFTRIGDDTRNLQKEYLEVLGGRSLTCITFFNDPAPLALDGRDAAAYADVAVVVDQINQAANTVKGARDPYDAACADRTRPFGQVEASDAYRPLLALLTPQDPNSLDAIEAALTAAEANTPRPTAIPPTPTRPPASPTPAPAQPTATTAGPTAIPGLAREELQRLLPQLYAPIDAVTAPRGAGTLLVTYWEEVNSTRSTAGCADAQNVTVPDDVALSEADLARSPELKAAQDGINSGLSAIRAGRTDFIFACNEGQLGLIARAPNNLANVRAGLGALNNARALLDALRGASDPLLLPSATP